VHLKACARLSVAIASDPRSLVVYQRMKQFTMVPVHQYLKNLALVRKFRHVRGAIVECGTWRGGMIAGIASTLGNARKYFLFDSFEGLPQARVIDGARAMAWQADTGSRSYFDNCRADAAHAEAAMKTAGVSHYDIIKGWFSETLPSYYPNNRIAVLRLDADWYDSTMACLTNLYEHVVPGGVVIIDDYHVWDGCSKAVHDFVAHNQLPVRISQYDNTVCYIVKQ